MSGCRFYGRCRRDPDTGEVLCRDGWRDSCPMEGVEADEDGFLVNTNSNGNDSDEEEETE